MIKDYQSSKQETPQSEEMPESGSGLEIEKIRERLEKIEPELEKEPTLEKREAVIKREIKERIKEAQETPDFAPPVSTRDEVKEISKFPANQQVGALISLVFEKGLERAVRVAKSLDNPAVLDEFHDILVDRYYEQLVKEKII